MSSYWCSVLCAFKVCLISVYATRIEFPAFSSRHPVCGVRPMLSNALQEGIDEARVLRRDHDHDGDLFSLLRLGQLDELLL